MDINGIGGSAWQKGLENIGQTGAGQGVTTPHETPGATDVERFDAAMQNEPPGMADTAQLQPGERVAQEIGALGDRIQASRAEVASLAAKPEVSQADLFKASFKMMETSALVSAVSKTSEKITSAIKTLQQG